MTTLDNQNTPSSKALHFSIDMDIATITLHREDNGNALDLDMALAFNNAVNQIVNTPSVRVILLTGTGKSFCVGGDIRAFIEKKENLPSFVTEITEPLHAALVQLEASNLPIVSAINGAVGGAGIGLALIADFVLAAESMKLRCGYTAIGLSPDAGSSWLLANRVGAFRARQLFLSNSTIDAQECLKLGIVDRVYPDSELMSQVQALVEQLRNGPATAFSRVKRLLDHTLAHRTFKNHLDLEQSLIIQSASEKDVQEGILAFTEKRKASFT
ncbi:MAG: enoyl-CoA hydratase-related protein [Pelistega sp.]|nr:enoyl-CoA hydratase-related protein [Pelistega sp.]